MIDKKKNTSPPHPEGRLLRFPSRGVRNPRPLRAGAETGDGLTRYQGGPEDPGEYRHRMKVNLAGFLVVVVLVGAALWIADTMATMRKNQDCVLSGRRDCSLVQVPVAPR